MRKKKAEKAGVKHADTIVVAKKRKYYWKVENERARSLGNEVLLTSQPYSSRKSALASARAYLRRHPSHNFLDITPEARGV